MAVLGAGRHDVIVASHVIGRSGTGTPHVAVLFEDDDGDRITWYGYLSDKALERTLESLAILGWDAQAHNGLIDSLNGTGLLDNAEASIVVEDEIYEGKSRPKVKWVNQRGSGLSEMDRVEADAFASSLRQKILSAAKPVPNGAPGPAKKAAPAAVPQSADGIGLDDDLPF